jgi:hypothetical protein
MSTPIYIFIDYFFGGAELPSLKGCGGRVYRMGLMGINGMYGNETAAVKARPVERWRWECRISALHSQLSTSNSLLNTLALGRGSGHGLADGIAQCSCNPGAGAA